MIRKFVPLGKYLRSILFAFSTPPFCHEEYGSQKKVGTPSDVCCLFSMPLSKVMESVLYSSMCFRITSICSVVDMLFTLVAVTSRLLRSEPVERPPLHPLRETIVLSSQ